jgi:hypothetical protein
MTRVLSLLVLVALVAAAGCGKKSGAAKSYPDTKDGLAALIGDIKKDPSVAKQLALKDPKGWLTKTFEIDKLVAHLAPDLEAATAGVETVGKAIQKKSQEGKTEVLVESFTSADDPNVTGRQGYLLKNAKNPPTLYSVRLYPPGSLARRSQRALLLVRLPRWRVPLHRAAQVDDAQAGRGARSE